MKVNVYFVDEHDSSRQNGIGTFRDQLLPLLSNHRDVKVTLISLNSDVDELEAIIAGTISEYRIPRTEHGNWRVCGDMVCASLRSHICDSNRNVFIINHSPCAQFIESLHRVFPSSKVIFVIHDQGWCAPLFGDTDRLQRIISGEENTELAISIRNYCRMEAEIYNNSDAVICISQTTYEILKSIYKVDPSKLALIPNGFSRLGIAPKNRHEVREELRLRQDERILIFAGRPARYKGVDILLKALAKIKDYGNWRCVFCGSMEGFRKYTRLIEDIAPKVIITGHLPKEQLMQWYCAADIGVVPSYSEQFCYSAIEMASYGLPLVVSDGNGLHDMFTDGINAFVSTIGCVGSPDEYVENLAGKLRDALNASPIELETLVENAHQEFSRQYSANLMAQRYATLCIKTTNNTM